MRIRILLLTLTVLVSYLARSQEYLVIDTTQSKLFKQEINQSLHNYLPCEDLYLMLNLDANGPADVRFKSTCDAGGWGSTSALWINGLSAFVEVDTMVIDSGYIPAYGTWEVDTFTVVKKYEYGDTIFMDNYFISSEEYIVNIVTVPEGQTPGWIFYLNEWEGSVGYIGFKMLLDGVDVLGWIKIEVVHSMHLIVEQTALYYPSLSLTEKEPGTLLVYPNPAQDYISFTNTHFDRIHILNLSGQVVADKQIIKGNQNLEVRALPAGLYIVHFSGPKGNSHTYFIKQ